MRALLLLLFSLPLAATNYTTTGAGSWSDITKWSPSPGAGNWPCKTASNLDAVNLVFAMTWDVPVTCGKSGPFTPYQAAQQMTAFTATGGGSAGNQLPASTYSTSWTCVDPNGVESAKSMQWVSKVVASGNTPRVTWPTLPAGCASRNLYASSSNNLTGSDRLFATGITGTTYDMACASSSTCWNNNTQAEGSAPQQFAQGAAILWTAGNQTLNGVSVTLRGDFRSQISGNSLIVKRGSTIQFDASQAAAPSLARYVWPVGNGGGSVNVLDTSDCVTATPCSIGSNKYGGTAYAAQFSCWIGTTSFGCGNAVSAMWRATMGSTRAGLYVDGLGDANTPSLVLGSVISAFTHTISGVIFGQNIATGPVYLYNVSGNTFAWTNVSFKNSAGANPFTTQDTNTHTGTFTSCFFDKVISHPSNLNLIWTFSNSFFYSGTTLNTNRMTATNNLIRLWWPVATTPGNYYLSGAVTGNYIMSDDNWSDDPTRLIRTAAVTSATSTTLTDSTATWTNSQFSPGSINSWSVILTGGTGAGQIRGVTVNTATQLSITKAWTTTPDATTTYQLWVGAGHQHTLNMGGTSTYTNNVWEYTGTDLGNHCNAHPTGSTNGLTFSYANEVSIPLINGGDGCNFGVGTSSLSTSTTNINHMTQMNEVLIGDYPTPASGLTSFKSNLYWTLTGNAFSSIYFLNEGTGDCTTLPTDQVTAGQADYNYGYNINAGPCSVASGSGYRLKMSAANGANDVRQAGATIAGGPDFAGCLDGGTNINCRSFYRYALARGADPALGYIGVMGYALGELKRMNDPTPSTVFSIADLYAWARAGYRPRNPLTNFTFPGDANAVTNAGAVPYQATQPPAIAAAGAVTVR